MPANVSGLELMKVNIFRPATGLGLELMKK
jgi:hypothetical protein